MPSALGKCLSIDPAKRNLHEALNALTGNIQPQLGPQENGRDILLRMSYDHHVLSWQQMRELEPAVQSFVFQSFRAKVEGLLSQQRVNAPDCFVLTSYYINGYGTKVNLEEAKRLFQICSNANYKHPPSRAYAYRIWKFLNPNFVTSESMITNLIQMALDGSRMAAMDLKEVAPDKYPEIETLIRDVLAGVGGNFFHAKEMLHGYVYDQWVRTLDNQEVLVQNFKNLNRIADYKVNKRGDGILHMAANTGRIQAIETLLANFPGLTLDQLNDKRETPLLCASRAGQVATVLRLVELGANASIVALNGESCLHWLVSFKDDDIDVIGGALIQGGADLRVFTREKVAHSVFWPTIEVDHQIPGTPLNWAVHHNRARIIQFLLNKASDAMICLDRATNLVGPSPLEYAAYYHHLECLELMLEALDEAKTTYSLEPIIRAGVHSADTFSMILRHGARYKERLHRFLDFCLRKSKGIVFMTGMGGFDTHLLYYAVSEGHDEVVEYLLSDEGKSLVESLNIHSNAGQSRPGVYDPSDINRPAREDWRTPVLEAIRWNRKSLVELLVTNGADPKALAKNPFSDEMNWTGFHILAIAGHNTDYSELVPFLIETGLLIDGIPSSDTNDSNGPAETPLLVAVQHNAFNLATTFLEHGADPNALCVSSGLLSLEFPTTILGQIVAASSQHTIPRLRYLIEQCPKSNAIEFIVEPARQVSVLHRAAWAHKGITHRVPDESNGSALSREEYDMVVNRDIMHELLQKWGDPETHLNIRCQIHGRTALHMAVEAGNLKAAELLVEKGADVSVCDDLGLTPVDLAGERLNELGDQRSWEQEVYAALISLLMGDRAVFFK
ncbi:uncharacterized protein N7473_000455 [Penicillium subrubescens]|nr:uncharacterized protein N7473_000455 [Penicillium subrubescens]KAJ5911152.1 hypothetical protein N7473_000455 [Penicillium subrubescens]